jgi:hypothetical protein
MQYRVIWIEKGDIERTIWYTDRNICFAVFDMLCRSYPTLHFVTQKKPYPAR